MVRRHRRPWWVYPIVVTLVLVEVIIAWLVIAAAVYTPEYVRRVLVWQDSDQSDYLHRFPLRELTASPTPYHYGDRADEARIRAAFETAFGVDDLEAFLAGTDTQALIVIRDDLIAYERYFAGVERDSMLTSFSVAKSFDSAMIGIAIDEGLIGSADDPITDYLPELADRDRRFEQISIRDLLMMSSGLDYSATRWALFNGDDALTTYYTDQRELVLDKTHVARPPGEVFSYNKYHPQFLGMILERTTGMSVTDYMQSRLWDPLGMEYDGAWALDSDDSGFEKMEAGLNARAIDYAKLGSLYLHGGEFNGRRIVSQDWVDASTHPDPTRQRADYYPGDWGREVYADGNGSYQLMWYGRLRGDAPPDFLAEGDHGQFIYVSPLHEIVIVRVGTSYGIASADWMNGFYAAVDLLD